MRIRRPIRVVGDIAIVPLTRGYEAVISLADLPIVERFNWCVIVAPTKVYATRTECGNGEKRYIYMHRAILNAPPGVLVDHRDGDGLNNQRSNLRFATFGENARNQRISKQNASGFKGVSWHTKGKRWVAQIKHEGEVIYLGGFTDPAEAHAAYCKASAIYHGEFGRTA